MQFAARGPATTTPSSSYAVASQVALVAPPATGGTASPGTPSSLAEWTPAPGCDTSTATEPDAPTPEAAVTPRLGTPGATPNGWPARIADAPSAGHLAPDGTSYFISGGYLVALDGDGRERAGWPQPLGFQTDVNAQMAFGSDGAVFAWAYEGGTVAGYAAGGTPLAGFPYRGSAIEEVLPVPQGVYVVSERSGNPECGDEHSHVTLIGSAGNVGRSWTLQGEFLAVGTDGTIYSRLSTPASDGTWDESILAYGSDGKVEPGWPADGWSDLTFDPNGRIYLLWWQFREMQGISMEGPGLAIETRIAAADASSKPYPGWPITIDGAASAPAFGSDGTVYMTREAADSSGQVGDSIVALDAEGEAKPGWPAAVPSDSLLLRSSPGLSATSPDPPQIGPDGSVYVGAIDASSQAGAIDAFDSSGQLKTGFPSALDWQSTSNIFFGYGSGWFAIGRTGLVFTTDGYSIWAVGPDGKAAPGWPVKVRSGTIVEGVDLEPDGGLLVETLQLPTESTFGIGPLADVSGARSRFDVPVGALAPDFPGTLTVTRYLPDGTVAR